MNQPPPNDRPFGAFEYFPDNLEWSTQMIRLFSYCWVRGADFSEVHSVARSLPVGDDAAWYEGFSKLAREVEASARGSADGGHDVTARDSFLRASIYHRISSQMADIAGIAVPPGMQESFDCFREAAVRMEPQFVPVEVPYGDVTLPGYLCVPESTSGTPRPAVISVGGIDAFAEEQYFKSGSAFVERGYATLLLNGPGQGEAKLRGIHGRHDVETAASAAVDFLSADPRVDSDRIALIGSSLGGYFAARAAAFEPRLRATVVWGAIEPGTMEVAHEQPESGRASSRTRQFMAYVGADSVEESELLRKTFLLGPEVMGRVSAPVLILHGESDVLVPVSVAQSVYNDIGHHDKSLIIYPHGQPGCAHCQLDALAVAQRDFCDWIDTKLQP